VVVFEDFKTSQWSFEIQISNLQGELERSKAHSAELTSNIINLDLALEQANKKIIKLEIEKSQLKDLVEFAVLELKEKEKEKAKDGEVNQQVVANIQELLARLPTASPYWLSLYHFLFKKLPQSTALQLFKTSPSSYKQAKNLQHPPPGHSLSARLSSSTRFMPLAHNAEPLTIVGRATYQIYSYLGVVQPEEPRVLSPLPGSYRPYTPS